LDSASVAGRLKAVLNLCFFALPRRFLGIAEIVLGDLRRVDRRLKNDRPSYKSPHMRCTAKSSFRCSPQRLRQNRPGDFVAFDRPQTTMTCRTIAAKGRAVLRYLSLFATELQLSCNKPVIKPRPLQETDF
jgi:hypothetical protein